MDYVLYAVTSLILLWFSWCYKNKKSKSSLPPGPHVLPIIGNLHMLGKLPHISLRNLAEEYGPIMSMRFGCVPTIVVSDSGAAKLFLKTYDKVFSGRPTLMGGKYLFYDYRDIVFSSNVEEVTKRRKVCTKEFLSQSRVESLSGVRGMENLAMIQKLFDQNNGGSSLVNLSQAFFSLSHNSVWAAISKSNFEDMSNQLLNVMTDVSKILIQGSISHFVPLFRLFDFGRTKRKMIAISKTFDDFGERVLQYHMSGENNPSDDRKCFINALLDINETDPTFTHQHIKALILDIFIGATDTSATTLEWTTSLLLKHPQCMASVQEEIDRVVGDNDRVNICDLSKMRYLKCVVKEVMRLYPPSPFGIPHECTETVNVEGYVIPKGTMILINYSAIGRDKKVWNNPEEFNPERFSQQEEIDFSGWSDYYSLAFGGGRRGCPGVHLGMQTILLGAARLFHVFELSLEGDPSQLDMTEDIGIVTPRATPLHVYLKPRVKPSKLRPTI